MVFLLNYHKVRVLFPNVTGMGQDRHFHHHLDGRIAAERHLVTWNQAGATEKKTCGDRT